MADTDLTLEPPPRAAASPLPLATFVRWTVRAGVAFVIFAYYRGIAYLDIFAAPRFLRGDWTTYVVSSNYLRTSPLLTVPIATVPDYIAPTGTNLAMTDSLPVISPVYRLLLEAWPDRPLQLVGWQVLLAIVLTFLTVARFLDAVTAVDLRPLPRELLTLALATVATLTPFWALQVTHPALMQQWILVWALAGALRRCPTVLRGHLRPIEPGWTGLGPICAAAAVQPYLIPMVALPALAPDLARLRRSPRQVVTKVAVALGAVIAISVVLGYLGGDARAGARGFGLYAADVATVLNPMRFSNWFDALHFAPGSQGGFGWLGAGAGGLVVVAAVLAIARRIARPSGEGSDRNPGSQWPARCLYTAIALLTIFAVLPHVRVFGDEVIDLTTVLRPVESLTAVFRVNGRFVWPVLWLAVLLASAFMLRAGRIVAPCMIGAALVVQLADLARPHSILRPQAQVEYGAARQALMTQMADGARSVQFQPPVVIPGCFNQAFGPQFERLGDVLLAAAVLRLPVNSGYTARPVPEFTINCRGQRKAFRARKYDPGVVYVVPAGFETPGGLTCGPMTREMLACRATSRASASGAS